MSRSRSRPSATPGSWASTPTLTCLRDRLLLARELLTESDSIFVQIGDENMHRVRCLMDEVFGEQNFMSIMAFTKTSGATAQYSPSTCDYLLWYARDKTRTKYRQLLIERQMEDLISAHYTNAELATGERRLAGKVELYDSSFLGDVRLFALSGTSSQTRGKTEPQPFYFIGVRTVPETTRSWSTTIEGLRRLASANRLQIMGNTFRYVRYHTDFPYSSLGNLWSDVAGSVQSRTDPKVYAVQTGTPVIARCLLMTTDPGDLVFDPTCGSGTTAYVAEQWGRRWITCDTSRVALAIARQRLMTAVFDYYELAHPEEGVGSGFKYKTVPHVTLKSIANNPEIDDIYARMHPAIAQALAELNRVMSEQWPVDSKRKGYQITTGGRAGRTIHFSRSTDHSPLATAPDPLSTDHLLEWEVPFEFPADWPESARPAFDRFHAARRAMRQEMDEAILRHAPQETLYDQPLVDRRKVRVTEPFTVEAVPAPVVKSPDEILEPAPPAADASSARSGETLRQAEWRDELLKTGIRAKAGQYIRFSRLEPLPGCRWLHAEGETKPESERSQPLRVVVSFGPEHAPLEQRQVQRAWEEAQQLVPKPKLLVFAAFQFDPEAAKDIDEMKPELAGMQFLKVQMNADLLTDDLKKKRASNQSFWLIGQPDVEVVSEQWLVVSEQGSGRKEALAPYDVVAKLSGLDRLAEISRLSRDDLSAFVAIAQRRDLWDAVAAHAGGGFDSGQHRRGASAAQHRGVPAISGHRPGLPSRIGDAADFVRAIESVGPSRRAECLERLRGNREIIERARQIAASLTPSHYPLATVHYSQVTVHGFDYYNTKTGQIESGGADKIALWMLDTDYDGRSLYPRQVFFPMAGENEGWARLARNLKAEIDESLIESYWGAVSLPFEAGEHKRIAVKIVDDRGIESLRVMEVGS